MQVFKGHSGAEDAAQAVREATTGWELKGAKIDLLDRKSTRLNSSHRL